MVWEGQTKDSFVFQLPNVTLINLYGIDYTPYLRIKIWMGSVKI